MTKPTIRPVWPAKTQIRLFIHPVLQGFSFIPQNIPEAVEDNAIRLPRLWSDCTAAQADLCLCLSHKSYFRFCRALTQMKVRVFREKLYWTKVTYKKLNSLSRNLFTSVVDFCVKIIMVQYTLEQVTSGSCTLLEGWAQDWCKSDGCFSPKPNLLTMKALWRLQHIFL